jgi:hypothetical protein
MVLTDISEKTRYYHSLRKIRAPKTLEGNTGLPQSNTDSQSASLGVAAPQEPAPDPAPPNSEFRNFTALPDHRFHAPSAAQSSASPDSSRAMGSSSSGEEMMLDIDWVS